MIEKKTGKTKTGVRVHFLTKNPGQSPLSGLESGRGRKCNLTPVLRDAKAGMAAVDSALDAKKRLGADAPLQRYQGPWSERDVARGRNGQGPLDMVPTRNALGREVSLQLHHPDHLPGRGVHEVSRAEHQIPGLHPSLNRGVTEQIRRQDRESHWKQRAKEQGGG